LRSRIICKFPIKSTFTGAADDREHWASIAATYRGRLLEHVAVMLRLTGRHSPGRADRRSPTRRPRGRFIFRRGVSTTSVFHGERNPHCL